MYLGYSGPSHIHITNRLGYRYDKKRSRRVAPVFKKWKIEDLTETLRQHIVTRDPTAQWFMVEDLSDLFKASKADVHRALQVLKTQGMHLRKINRPPHDIYRNSRQSSSGWTATVYLYDPLDKYVDWRMRFKGDR